ADNIGLTGVAPRVKIMDVRAFDARGRATIDAIVKALDYAVRNLSWKPAIFEDNFRKYVHIAAGDTMGLYKIRYSSILV
ncbi:MAG: hypothetical protein QXI19_07070, partial [Candidatus Caldarchaeum sp.]